MRTKIHLNMTIQEVVSEMSEGNQGAISVMMMILEKEPMRGIFDILSMDDMNIRGPQIWLAFKDFAGQDLDKMLKAVRERDPQMVTIININFPNQVAVTNGASFHR